MARLRLGRHPVIMVTGDHPHRGRRSRARSAWSKARTRWSSPAMNCAACRQCGCSWRPTASRRSSSPALPRAEMLIVEALKKKARSSPSPATASTTRRALKTADIGIAMGSRNRRRQGAADLILLDDNFASIVAAIRGRPRGVRQHRKFLDYILTVEHSRTGALPGLRLLLASAALTYRRSSPSSLGTDMLPALALGAEKPDPAAMRRPPRPRGEPLLT